MIGGLNASELLKCKALMPDDVSYACSSTVFPYTVSITRDDLRAGLNDFVWMNDDIYVKADVVSPSGKSIRQGKSKSKAQKIEDQPVHGAAYVTLE